MYYSLTRYIALAKARLDPASLCTEGLLRDAGKRKRKPRAWSPLEHIYVPHCSAADGRPTLDGTVDGLAYQLFRDNLLPSVVKGGTSVRGKPPSAPQGRLEHLQERSEELQRDALSALEERVEEDMARSRGGVVLRRSVAETALVIGCDEAGRGPLAGPVVAAAVCRVPTRAFTKPPTFAVGGRPLEPFPVADSKKLPEAQRKANFETFTGCSNIFDLIQHPNTRLRLPRWFRRMFPLQRRRISGLLIILQSSRRLC